MMSTGFLGDGLIDYLEVAEEEVGQGLREVGKLMEAVEFQPRIEKEDQQGN